MDNVDPDTLDALVEKFKRKNTEWLNAEHVVVDRHCSPCGAIRRHFVRIVAKQAVKEIQYYRNVLEQVAPLALTYWCMQCESESTGVIYDGPQGYDLVVLPGHDGGIRTPHTPDAVAYYLDQAWRARNVGARSAAAAMYRAALEQLLFEQGYQSGMLAAKISSLEADVAKRSGPAWAQALGTEELTALKDIGNGSIHTNGGDIAKQAAIDAELVTVIEGFVTGLLDEVYEVPIRRKNSRALMQAAAQSLKKP